MSTEERYYPSVLDGDKGVTAHIYDNPKAALLIKESKDKGEHIYQTRTYIKIRVKGSVDLVNRPLQEKDVERFPDAWNAYKGASVMADRGTPLKVLELEEPQITFFSSRGIYTVEDLAYTPPDMIKGLRFGLIEIQRKARTYLGLENVEKKLTAETENLKKENEDLRGELEQIKSMLIELTNANQNEPKKRGRKPKEEIEDDTPDSMPRDS